MGGEIQKINATEAQLQGDVGSLEGVLASAEQDRANKDDQIRTLKDEIAHQSDMIRKLSKEAISDLERVKAELLGGVSRKEKEASALSAKIDDEATLAAKYAKQAKELMARIEELEEELNVERGNRAKAEKSRTMLKKDIEDISSRLEEAGSNTATQVELNKKREGELARLKAELEELNIAQEGTLAALRMKHNNTMADLGEQIDSLNANKVKSEKDKAGMELDLRDARLDLEDAVKGKAELDKQGKLLQASIVDSNTRLDEMARALNEAESTKKRLQVENQDLNRQIEELENAIANMNKAKISVTTQLEDTKSLSDSEAKDRAALLTKYKNMSTDLENLKEKLDNEQMRKSDALKALSKAQAETQLWKSRYETEGMGRIEELEMARNKLQAKIVENEELVDVLATKVANAEKSKSRLASDLDDLSMEYERVHAAALITEKRAKNFDKVLRAQLGLAQVRQGIDRRVAEKEEEFNNTRKNHARAMDSLGASIETEQRAKGEALRVKKQLEGEINELEIGLDHANKANSEGLKSVKRYQNQLRETIQAFEDEARSRAQIIEQVGICERKAAALSGEVEESKALLDSAGRTQRQLQNDIADSRAAVNNMQTINARDMTAKRQLESSIHTLQAVD